MGVPAEINKSVSVEEYFRRSETLDERYDFYDGQMLAMAGASFEHALIISNITREMGNRLKGRPCQAIASELRVAIPRKTIYVYPDVIAVCGKPEFHPPDQRFAVANPTLIVEVLSESTEAYDRGEKFDRYREIESFREYLLVAQNRVSVESFYRQDDGTWLFTPASTIESSITLRSLGITLPISEFYSTVDFPPENTGQPRPAERASD